MIQQFFISQFKSTGLSLSVTVLVLFLSSTLLVACDSRNSERPVSSISLHTGLGGDASGFKRACGAREFSFPDDHGSHPEYRNEWWYITGNVNNDSGQRFGFHVTFFRIATRPLTSETKNTVASTEPSEDEGSGASSWATNEFFMAHFAVTSATDQSIRYFERFARSAAGLAGVNVVSSDTAQWTTRVWLDDWELSVIDSLSDTGLDKDADIQSTIGTLLTIDISQDSTGLDLSLHAVKPPVLQGENGYSQKSSDPCNSSYYYALTRLDTTGTIVFDGKAHNISGSSWLDREWSSSALSEEQSGWDWFALQLDDGRDIMLYQLRLQDGSVDSFSHAVEIDVDGGKNVIPLSSWQVDVEEWWHSDTGSRYPVAGSVRRKDTGEVINYKPLIEDQELDLTVRYWEGAISLANEAGDSIGRGYMELTGY